MFWQKSLSLLSVLISVFSTVAVSSAVEFDSLPAPDRGAPNSTAGGGTRGNPISCSQGETPLTALMPTRHNIGKTAAAKPAFFVYVPKTTATEAEFIIIDLEGNEVYEQTFKLENTAGIVKVSLPQNAPDLEINKEYEWQFALICNPNDRTVDEFVLGEIERTPLSPDLQTKIEGAQPLEQAKLYAREHFWNDTVAILAEIRSSNEQEWSQLLRSVGLEAIASAPFTPCCTASD